jgi:hypothetical protein
LGVERLKGGNPLSSFPLFTGNDEEAIISTNFCDVDDCDHYVHYYGKHNERKTYKHNQNEENSLF